MINDICTWKSKFNILMKINSLNYFDTDFQKCKPTVTALMSDSCPGNVCRHIPSLMSHSLAEASQAPETNVLIFGDNDNDMTSPVWPVNCVHC